MKKLSVGLKLKYDLLQNLTKKASFLLFDLKRTVFDEENIE